MAFSRLNFSKLWTNPTDFPTVELDETQVRADMQLLHDEAKTALNKLMSALEAKTGAASLGAKAKDGSTKSTVQAELDALNALIVAAGNLPGGGSAGQYLKKNSDKNFDAAWVALTHDSLAYLGAHTISTLEEDTPANWLAKGTGYSYYYNTTTAAQLPATRGFLFNTTQGTYVVQEWVTAATGDVYHRVGNTANGWLTSWVQAATKDYVDSYALPKTGGEMTGDLTVKKSVPAVTLNHTTNSRNAILTIGSNGLYIRNQLDTNNRSSILLNPETGSLDTLLRLMTNVDGASGAYNIFHTGNVESLLGASKIATGIYTGNGNESQSISIGFTPKVVIIVSQYYGSALYSTTGNYGPLIVTTERNPAKHSATYGAIAEITSDGFEAYYYNENSTGKGFSLANTSGKLYYYIAIG